MTQFSIIAAMDEANGIGKDGEMPWHLSADLKYFARTTKSTQDSSKQNAVIMGRKTWESIPERYRPFSDRLNIVLTRQDDYTLPDGVLRAASLDDALSLAEQKGAESIFVVGGGNVYANAIQDSRCHKLYITRIHQTFVVDTRFPAIDKNQFEMKVSSEVHEENGLPFQFMVYNARA